MRSEEGMNMLKHGRLFILINRL